MMRYSVWAWDDPDERQYREFDDLTEAREWANGFLCNSTTLNVPISAEMLRDYLDDDHE
jgi:hypothetical protein